MRHIFVVRSKPLYIISGEKGQSSAGFFSNLDEWCWMTAEDLLHTNSRILQHIVLIVIVRTSEEDEGLIAMVRCCNGYS